MLATFKASVLKAFITVAVMYYIESESAVNKILKSGRITQTYSRDDHEMELDRGGLEELEIAVIQATKGSGLLEAPGSYQKMVFVYCEMPEIYWTSKLPSAQSNVLHYNEQ